MEKSAYYEFRDHEDRHWWFIGRKSIFCHILRRFASRSQAAERRVLDLGCGMGGMLAELAEFGQVYGTDISQEALAHCSNRGFRRVFRATGGHLPFRDSTFDIVTAFDTIEHIPDDEQALSECARILKPGGLIVVSVPAYQFLYTHQDRVVHHQRRYTARMLKKRLKDQGFEPLRVSYINFLLFPLILPIVLCVKLKQAFKRPTDEDAKSNVSVPVPRTVNSILARIFSSERHVHARIGVPAGHSLLAVAQKPQAKGGS